MEGTCTNCKKASSELKRCAKCSTTLYCSRDCQKADWKTHKKICGKQAHERSGTGGDSSAGTALSPPKGLESPITKPFTRLDNNTYLHDRPEEDVYRKYDRAHTPFTYDRLNCLISHKFTRVGVLIDAYRMRLEDEYVFEGNTAVDSIYGGAKSSITGFRKFLRLAASRPGLLPPWWNASKQKACEELGMSSSQWHDLRCAVEKSDVVEHYGDPRFPMQLRMLAEMVIGRGFAGNDGTEMRTVMVMMENGGVPGRATSMATVDVWTGNSSIMHA
ncbi:putative MYND domain protein [Xylaria sp. FL0043]|nr:putative MYND domain protein [Xylaria sp. FL0043]